MTKYGDEDNVKNDVKTLNDIISRQGASLLVDVLAEKYGKAANQFNLNGMERMKLVDSTLEEIRESMLERL